MSLSNIIVNGISASFVEVPINEVVNLSNDGDGAEATIIWTSATGSQPSGSFDSVSSPSTFTPTITPTKEGNYLINHIIDGSITGSVVLSVRYLKSNIQSPAAGEKVQFGSDTGWARNVQALHSAVDNLVSDGGTIVGYANSALEKGQIVRMTGSFAAKAGLPGEDITPVFSLISGEASGSFRDIVHVVEGPVTGTLGTTLVPSGTLFYARLYGLHGPVTGSAVDGDQLWIRSDSVISPSFELVDRKIGTVIGSTGGTYYVNFNGTSDFSTPNSAIGDVVGPAASSGSTIALFDNSSGKLLRSSSLEVSDGGQLAVTTEPSDALAVRIRGVAGLGIGRGAGNTFNILVGSSVQVAVTTAATVFKQIGSLGSAALAIASEASTGWYRPAANVIGFQNLGKESVRYDINNNQINSGSILVTSGSAGVQSRELQQAGTIPTDAATSNVFEINLTGSAQLTNPINLQSGHTYIWVIKQAITSTGSLTYDTAFKFPGGTVPTLTTAVTDVSDILSAVCSGSTLLTVFQGDFR